MSGGEGRLGEGWAGGWGAAPGGEGAGRGGAGRSGGGGGGVGRAGLEAGDVMEAGQVVLVTCVVLVLGFLSSMYIASVVTGHSVFNEAGHTEL